VAAFAADPVLWGPQASRPQLVDALRVSHARVQHFVENHLG
jgi:hypothetical protein